MFRYNHWNQSLSSKCPSKYYTSSICITNCVLFAWKTVYSENQKWPLMWYKRNYDSSGQMTLFIISWSNPVHMLAECINIQDALLKEVHERGVCCRHWYSVYWETFVLRFTLYSAMHGATGQHPFAFTKWDCLWNVQSFIRHEHPIPFLTDFIISVIYLLKANNDNSLTLYDPCYFRDTAPFL